MFEFNLFIIFFLVFLTGVFYYYNDKKRQLFYDPSKVILITGCDSGFGYSLALHVVESGGSVIATSLGILNGHTFGILSLEEKCKSLSGRLFILPLDLSNEDSINQLPQSVERILTEINCNLWALVNNAGVLIFGEAEMQTHCQIRHQFQVNTIGPMSVTKNLLPFLRKEKGSRIVNIISFCTDCPLPTLAIYTASKSALKTYSEALRMEVSKFGIHVIVFNPGDHPKETSMCSNQSYHYEAMESELGNVEESVRNYFHLCKNKFSHLFETPPIVQLRNPKLYSIFDSIIWNTHPSFEYVNSDWMTKIFFAFLKVLPRCYADVIRIMMLRLPDYKEH